MDFPKWKFVIKLGQMFFFIWTNDYYYMANGDISVFFFSCALYLSVKIGNIKIQLNSYQN